MNQLGGGNCTLCRSPGTNKSTCPLNPDAKSPNPAKHPLAMSVTAPNAPLKIVPNKAPTMPTMPTVPTAPTLVSNSAPVTPVIPITPKVIPIIPKVIPNVMPLKVVPKTGMKTGTNVSAPTVVPIIEKLRKKVTEKQALEKQVIQLQEKISQEQKRRKKNPEKAVKLINNYKPHTPVRKKTYDDYCNVFGVPTSDNVNEFLIWSYYVIQLIENAPNKGSYVYEHVPIQSNEPFYTIIHDLSQIPNDSIDIITGEPYTSDPEWHTRHYVKLLNCDTTCSNHGIFAKDEIDASISSGSEKCPYCGEAFRVENGPPYGKVYVRLLGSYTKYKLLWIDFSVDERVVPPAYPSRTIDAYLPYHPAFHIDCMLGLWIMLNAFSKGKLFNLGNSLTTGQYGVTFGNIHMKTSYKIETEKTHGYSRMHMIEYIQPNGIFDHIMSESQELGLKHPYSAHYENETIDKLRYVLRSINPDILSRYFRFTIHKDTMPHVMLRDLIDITGKNGNIAFFMQFIKDWGRYDTTGITSNPSKLALSQRYALDKLFSVPSETIIDLINKHYEFKLPLRSLPATPWPVFVHDETSLINGYITPKIWNQMASNLNFTKVGSIHGKWRNKDHWSTECSGHYNTSCTTVSHAANYHVAGERMDTLLVFHGSHLEHLDSFAKGIDIDRGGGILGPGFYFTLNPNEAKGYGLRAQSFLEYPEKISSGYLVLYEMILRNTDTNLSLAVNPHVHTQFRGRKELLNNLTIVRAHVFHYRGITVPMYNNMNLDKTESSTRNAIEALQIAQAPQWAK
jgi:hypothetical protein